ncbi:hypothetical protein U9M48_037422 [Paspalum notatum var. saurae]|uniref:Uncharacterized protein n=1 Tax=Paspalum notatum var. saurae TaxID=547442 RepID=A0AAQ3UJ43_PASNO
MATDGDSRQHKRSKGRCCNFLFLLFDQKKKKKITGLGVMGQHATATAGPSSSANNMQDTRLYKEIAASEGLLLLPAQLKELGIFDYPELSLHSNPLDDNEEEGRTGRGGLQGLSSLRRLEISGCPKLLASYSSSSSSCYFPFPNSLEYLCLEGKVGTEALVPLSNLSSLATLILLDCDLRCEGLLSLITQGHLTQLCCLSLPNVFVGSESSQLHDLDLPSRSSKLKELSLHIDDVDGFTATPICSLLCSSLTKLEFYGDRQVECFTEEQETPLLANSLEEIRFVGCDSLQYLPARLHTLHNLKTLHLDFYSSQLRSLPDVLPSSLQKLSIQGCHGILSLPDPLPSSLQELCIKNCSGIRPLPDRLPSSLQELVIKDCEKMQSLPKDGLPSSLQKLEISSCPAIRSLPKVDDLPSSLREIDVILSGSEELIRQCRNLIGIIPIVKA